MREPLPGTGPDSLALDQGGKMTVVSLVGPSASGKTTLLDLLSPSYNTLTENYVELDKWELDNRLFISKWTWIANWFDRVLTAHQRGTTLLVTDRAPTDAAAYHEDGHQLFLPLLSSLVELASLGIHCHIVYLYCDWNVLKDRMVRRLEMQPFRQKYHELDYALYTRIYAFYEAIIRPKASLVLDTTRSPPEATLVAIIAFVESISK